MDKKLNAALNVYCLDSSDYNANLQLAKCYHNLGQTAAAVSFYLRAAEFAEYDTDVQYNCLLKAAECFTSQGNRENTVKGLYLHAINVNPTRPEAYYYLSKLYELQKKFIDSYTIAVLGITNATLAQTKFKDWNLDYPGEYALYFQKAVSAWWWGKHQESRDTFKFIADNYAEKLDTIHYHSVQNNLLRLGIGEESQSFKYFTEDKAERLRYKFPNYQKIKNNYSQVYQDMFVLSMTDGKENGTYLEIGSAGSYHGNNTVLLEKLFSWKGVGIEYNPEFIPEYEVNRSNPILCINALDADYHQILNGLADENGVIDYLQLDCEPSKTTYDIMEKIPFDTFKFRVITYEHDDYVDMTKLYRRKSREFLASKGYVLVVNDVSPDGKSNFEDWWVHPELVNPVILERMKTDGISITKIEDHMLISYP